ncbi:MAG: manganese efflux pump [Labilithrix sp.]|nr:manganese efflux pump [Labilithrix sp.]
MAFVEVVVLAVALAMDAMAVAGVRGLAAKTIRARDALLVATFFGGAQAAMPALGWLAGATFASRIGGWGHWLTFVVLVGLGLKMIHEAVTASGDPEDESDSSRPFGLKVLAVLAVATSIDALAAGVTLAVRGASIAVACATIGLVTAALSFAGVYVGHRFGARVGKRLDVLGGVVLVGLGVKALLEHFLAT